MGDVVTTDVLVIGGGGAGCRAAIAVDDSGSRCVMVTKGPVAHSGATAMACPSYQAAAAMQDPRDSTAQAFVDTSREGRFLGDEDLVHAMVSEATDRATDMEGYGVKFRRNGNRLLQVTHPGQSFPRTLVIKGAGYSMMFYLRRELLRRPGIKLVEDALVTRLIMREGRVVGADVLDLTTALVTEIRAGAVIIATGGYPELWLRTDTTPELTGDGQKLALDAGAELVDMEMMLWYPTCLTAPQQINGTLVQYEGLLNPEYCGGVMLNARGETILPPGVPPVRDVMMRIMFTELDEGRGTESGGVYIDLRASQKPMAEIRKLLRRLDSLPYHNLADLGVDIAEEPIEVAPATHFTIGGIRIDVWGRTTVPGLYACGEAAGNVHGANRTSGNALTETQVFGARAGKVAAEDAAIVARFVGSESDETSDERMRVTRLLDEGANSLRPRVVKQSVKHIMDAHVGHRRDHDGMTLALGKLQRLRTDELPRMRAARAPGFHYELQEAIEAIVMVDVAEVVIASALSRTESRGHHWRTDHPDTDPDWLRHTVVRKDGNSITMGTTAVTRIERSALDLPREPIDVV